MDLHVASGYDPDVYGFTWEDFTSCTETGDPSWPHTWVITVFHVTAPDTFAPVTGCLTGWDGRELSVLTRDGRAVTVTPVSVYVLGDACPHRAHH